jgi:hypothetical protein
VPSARGPGLAALGVGLAVAAVPQVTDTFTPPSQCSPPHQWNNWAYEPSVAWGPSLMPKAESTLTSSQAPDDSWHTPNLPADVSGRVWVRE